MGPESCCQMAAGLTKSRGGNVTQLLIAAGIHAIGSRHLHPSETLRPRGLYPKGHLRNHDMKTELKQDMCFPNVHVLSVGKRGVCGHQPLQPLDLKMASRELFSGGALCGDGSRSSRLACSPIAGTPCRLGRLAYQGGLSVD